MKKHFNKKSLPSLDAAMLATLPVGVGIVDLQGRFLYLNPALESLVGTDQPGKLYWEVCMDSAQQHEECLLRRPFEMGATHAMEYSGIFEGETYLISHTGVSYQGADAVMLMHYDIAEQILDRLKNLETERNRISRDIHDDLGATVTQVKLLGEMLELDAADPGLVKLHARLISDKARELAEAMDEIVWSNNPDKDHLENLTFYLGRYAEEFIRLSGLELRLDLPDELPDLPLAAPVRHRLFMVTKEILNNAVKHAGARMVRLSLQFSHGLLLIEIEDDGIGFNPAAHREGNGLRNLRRGMAEIGGGCIIDSVPGRGTRVQLSLDQPLSGSPH